MKAEHALKQLKNTWHNGRFAQAYLIVGPPEGEALALTEEILLMIHCKEQDDGCRQCSVCRQICKRAHPDVQWLEPEKKSRVISVDQIRGLRERMAQTAYSGWWKAGVIVAADRLGTQAANAFLKTLEEPAEKTVFFLLSDTPSALLPTIVSRCQRISLHENEENLPEEIKNELIEILRSRVATGSGACSVAAFGYASRITNLLRGIKQCAEDHVKTVAQENGREIDNETVNARAGARYKGIRSEILRFMINWHRDIAVLAAGGDPLLVKNTENIDVLQSEADRMGCIRAIHEAGMIEQMNDKLERNLTEETVFSFGMGRMFEVGERSN